MVKAGNEAMKISASSEALNYYKTALEMYIKKRGEAVDIRKISELEENIATAFFNKGDFVEAVLKAADEQLERRYRLKVEGFNLEQVAGRVAEVLDIPVEGVWEKSRRPQVVEARSLLCFWANTELGMSMTELAGCLGLTQPAVSKRIAALEDEVALAKKRFGLQASERGDQPVLLLREDV